jgi:hypothetical protein
MQALQVLRCGRLVVTRMTSCLTPSKLLSISISYPYTNKLSLLSVSLFVLPPLSSIPAVAIEFLSLWLMGDVLGRWTERIRLICERVYLVLCRHFRSQCPSSYSNNYSKTATIGIPSKRKTATRVLLRQPGGTLRWFHIDDRFRSQGPPSGEF